jgi:hypothetical protein
MYTYIRASTHSDTFVENATQREQEYNVNECYIVQTADTIRSKVPDIKEKVASVVN